MGRGADARPARRAGAPDGRRLGLRLAQAQGRGAAADGGVRRDRGAARRLPVDLPLRLDPNGAWTPATSLEVADAAGRGRRVPRGPDPRASPGWPRSSARHRRAARDQHVRHRDGAPAARDRAGRRAGRALRPPPVGRAAEARRCSAGITETWGLGLSMHSNSHLGVSLAAMVHLAAATPNLTYACDTHYPWKTQDVDRPGVLSFVDGSVAVPTGPGLGVSSTATGSASCTSSTSPAAYAGARTPSTCAPSSPTSGRTPPAGEPSRRAWHRDRPREEAPTEHCVASGRADRARSCARTRTTGQCRRAPTSTRRSHRDRGCPGGAPPTSEPAECGSATAHRRGVRRHAPGRCLTHIPGGRDVARTPLSGVMLTLAGDAAAGVARGAAAWRRGRSRRHRRGRRRRRCRARAGPARRGWRRSWSTRRRGGCAGA